MAVPVEAGIENVIRFEYTTPGLYIGIMISAGAFLILLAYYLMIRRLRKKYPDEYGIKRYAHLRHTESVDNVKASRAYSYSVMENCKILSALSVPKPDAESGIQPAAPEKIQSESSAQNQTENKEPPKEK